MSFFTEESIISKYTIFYIWYKFFIMIPIKRSDFP
jgi:hypothetical protein